MTRCSLVFLLLVLFSAEAFAQKDTHKNPLTEICLTQVETELYRLISEYRTKKGLPEISLSASLSIVARTHAIDQAGNFREGSRCNMHSWSGKGEWSSCCYTADHKKAKCMWDKPRELTGYTGDGFEISFYSNYPYSSPAGFAKDILDGWKKSPGHNDMILNKGMWKKVRWQSIGIGIYGEFANVWFGEEEDSAGKPGPCE